MIEDDPRPFFPLLLADPSKKVTLTVLATIGFLLILGCFILLQSTFSFSTPSIKNSKFTTGHIDSIINRSLNQFTNTQYTLHPDLLQLCSLTHLSLSTSPTLQEVIQQTQKYWLRPSGTERHELKSCQYETLKGFIYPLLRHLHLTDTVYATDTQMPYEVVLIHGAMAETIEKRMQFLAQEYHRGVRFKTIVLLSGDRPLDPKQEAFYLQLGLTTEAEVMQYIWDHLQGIPYSVKTKAQLIDTPGKKIATHYDRPTTRSTIERWLRLTPPIRHIRCLAVSSQPFVPFQDFVLYNTIKTQQKNLYIETIGPEANPNESLSVHLDNIARCLYELGISIKKQ